MKHNSIKQFERELRLIQQELIFKNKTLQSVLNLNHTNEELDLFNEVTRKELLFHYVNLYETIEHFFKSLLVELVADQQNLEKIISSKKHIQQDYDASNGHLESFVTKIKGKNNKGVFPILSTIYPSIEKFESNNPISIPLNTMLSVLTQVRHTCMHNKQQFTPQLQSFLSSKQTQLIYNKYFNTSIKDDNIYVSTSIEQLQQILLDLLALLSSYND